MNQEKLKPREEQGDEEFKQELIGIRKQAEEIIEEQTRLGGKLKKILNRLEELEREMEERFERIR